MTPEERETALEQLEASRRAYVGALDGLTEAQWGFRTGPDRWSIADCAEHLVAAEVALPKLIAGARRRPDALESQPTDDAWRRVVRDRSQRFEAPERIRPKGRFAGLAETLNAFAERRNANIAFVRTTQSPLRDLFFPHPFAGEIDGYQWVLFLPAHVERHLEQVGEIRLDAAFPKS
jgi:hypothetical protein